jgi:hypothetical protein
MNQCTGSKKVTLAVGSCAFAAVAAGLAMALAVATGLGKQESEANPHGWRETTEGFAAGGLVLLRDEMRLLDGYDSLHQAGVIVNRGPHEITYARVTFRAFNAKGEHVGTPSSSTGALAPGGRWAFKVLGANGAVRFELVELIGRF